MSIKSVDNGRIKTFIDSEKPSAEQLKDFYEKNKDSLNGYDFNMMFYEVNTVQETKEIFNQMKSDGFVIGEALPSYVYGLISNKNQKNNFLLDELIAFTDEQTCKQFKDLPEAELTKERTKTLTPVFKIFMASYEDAKRGERAYEGNLQKVK